MALIARPQTGLAIPSSDAKWEYGQRDLTWVIVLIEFREVERLSEVPGIDDR